MSEECVNVGEETSILVLEMEWSVYLVCVCVSVMFFYLSKTDLVMSTTKKCVQTITVSMSYW